MNDDKRIAEIRERCEKATAGPWKREPYELNTATIRETKYGKRTAVVYTGDVHHEDQNDPDEREQLVSDTEFIAHARSDLPYLLEKITALEAKLAEAEKRSESLQSVIELRAENEMQMIKELEAEFNKEIGAVKGRAERAELESARLLKAVEFISGAESLQDCRNTALQASISPSRNPIYTELSTLRRQVEEARGDTERLDLLERLVGKHGFHDFGFAVERYNTTNRKEKLRDAIDTALQQLAQRGEGK